MLKKASDVIATGDLGEIVDFAIDLNRTKLQYEKELEEIKIYLRAEAKRRGQGSFEVELEGLSGVISVTFPGLSLKAKKGKDLRDLEESLPAEAFSQLFHKTVEIVPAMPADDFLEALARMKPEHRNTVRHFLATEPMTPKVFIPR